MKYMPSQVLDLDFLVLNLDLGTVNIERELGLAVSLDLPTAVLGLNDEAEVLDARVVGISVLLNLQLVGRLRDLLAVQLDLDRDLASLGLVVAVVRAVAVVVDLDRDVADLLLRNRRALRLLLLRLSLLVLHLGDTRSRLTRSILRSLIGRGLLRLFRSRLLSSSLRGFLLISIVLPIIGTIINRLLAVIGLQIVLLLRRGRRVVVMVLLRGLGPCVLRLLGLRLARQRDVDMERCSTLRDVLALRVLCLDRERRPAGRPR